MSELGDVVSNLDGTFSVTVCKIIRKWPCGCSLQVWADKQLYHQCASYQKIGDECCSGPYFGEVGAEVCPCPRNHGGSAAAV